MTDDHSLEARDEEGVGVLGGAASGRDGALEGYKSVGTVVTAAEVWHLPSESVIAAVMYGT